MASSLQGGAGQYTNYKCRLEQHTSISQKCDNKEEKVTPLVTGVSTCMDGLVTKKNTNEQAEMGVALKTFTSGPDLIQKGPGVVMYAINPNTSKAEAEAGGSLRV